MDADNTQAELAAEDGSILFAGTKIERDACFFSPAK